MRTCTASFLAAAVGFSLLLTGCSSAQNNTFTAQDAIAKYKSKYVSDFPDKPGVWETVYRKLYGPYNNQLKMEVETEVSSAGENAYILTLTEKWSNLDYPRGSHLSVEKFLQHQSKVRVTPTSITFLGESGAPEPTY